MKYRNAPTVCSILVLLLANVNGQRSTVTSTKTTLVTKTDTFYISTYALCASMSTSASAVVTNCRRRRQYWIDVPVYIALDEDVDDQLTQFFHPSSTYQVEPTIRPVFKTDEGDSWLPSNWLGPSHGIQSSIFSPITDGGFTEERAPEPIGFAALANLINQALIAAGLADPTTVVTETDTTTKTTTKTTTTSTKTFYLVGCRPNPFPFTQCK